jgi:hydrogenase-4 component E
MSMQPFLEIVLIGIVLVNLSMLGSARITSCIRYVGLQGLLAGLLPVLLGEFISDARAIAVMVVAIGVKAFLMPWLLTRAIREAHVRSEVEPFLGFTASVLVGAVLTASAFALAARFPGQDMAHAPLLIPVAIATFLNGALLMVSRRKAIMQVVGYLVLENGIFLFGQSVITEMPAPVELGILLDVLVGVFVMGIAIFRINREFDSMGVHHLAELRD